MKNFIEGFFSFCVVSAFALGVSLLTFYPWLTSVLFNAKHDNILTLIVFDLILSPLGWLHGVALILF